MITDWIIFIFGLGILFGLFGCMTYFERKKRFREGGRAVSNPPKDGFAVMFNGRMEAAAVAGAMAVADDNTLWRAVHQVIDDAEQSTINAARSATHVPNECAAHTAAGEALDLLRKRLVRLREEGIRGSQRSEVRGQRSDE